MAKKKTEASLRGRAIAKVRAKQGDDANWKAIFKKLDVSKKGK